MVTCFVEVRAVLLGEVQHKITQFLRVVAFSLFTQGFQQALDDGPITIDRTLCYSTMTSHPVVKLVQQRWPFGRSGRDNASFREKGGKVTSASSASVYFPLHFLSLPRAFKVPA